MFTAVLNIGIRTKVSSLGHLKTLPVEQEQMQLCRATLLHLTFPGTLEFPSRHRVDTQGRSSGPFFIWGSTILMIHILLH